MKLIVGLGNPGRIYINSRHNIGFSVVRAVSKAYAITLKKENGILSLSGKGRIDGESVILAMPLAFMNLSGSVVGQLIKKYKVEPECLLVVCDDLDLGLGRLKLRPAGSSGGHKGLKSIIDFLCAEDFARLRIGIDRPVKDTDPSEYVLSSFKKKERTEVAEALDRATQCCADWAVQGITPAMNIYNKRSKG